MIFMGDYSISIVFGHIILNLITEHCRTYEYSCESSAGCINPKKICDSVVDCSDGSDEKYCFASEFGEIFSIMLSYTRNRL